MIKINLVPPELLAQWSQKRMIARISLGAVVAIAVMIIASMCLWMRLKHFESRLLERQAVNKKLASVVAKVKEAESLAAELQGRLKVIDDLNKGRRAYPLFMCDFVRSVPGGVRVVSLTTTGGGPSIKINLAARARSNADIASWLRRLEASGRFSVIELGPVAVDAGGEGASRAFTVTAVYSTPG